jgi:hypothetical protein
MRPLVVKALLVTGSLAAASLAGAGLAVSPAAAVAAPAPGTAAPASETWAKTGSMTAPREDQTAILLRNGQVLMMGGTAELYDPATGKFTATGSMTTARAALTFTATVLQNGQVLVAGGGAGSGATSSAELYDPATGTFSVTGSMATAREDFTATLLNNGQVLVAGGVGCISFGCTAVSSAELYNPATGTWTPTGSMSSARAWDTATLLPDGQVLVAGGGNGSTTLSSAKLYNPATGTFSPTGSMTAALNQQMAGLLPSGKVLVICQRFANCQPELYDPATGTWTAAGAADQPGTRGSNAVILNNGQVLLSGGVNGAAPGAINITAAATLFDPVAGTTTVTGSMTIPRTAHSLTVLQNGQVLAAGGETQNNVGTKSVTQTAELYTP